MAKIKKSVENHEVAGSVVIDPIIAAPEGSATNDALVSKAVELQKASPEGKAMQASVQAEVEMEVNAVRVIGTDIINKTGELAGLYLTLCRKIRESKHLGPKVVALELKLLGFHRSRITEINRVANAPDDVWKNYDALLIGFNKAITFARQADEPGSEATLTEAGKLLIDEGKVTLEDGEGLFNAELGKDEEPDKKGKTPSQKTDAAVKVIFANAKKNKVWNVEGWKLVLTKVPVKAVEVQAN